MTERVRIAFTLELPRGSLAEYRRRHDELWPELRQAITDQGGHNYSLHYDDSTERVFGYLEVDDADAWNAGATSEVTQRWWSHMADLMPTNPDHSPVSHPLLEVFHQV